MGMSASQARLLFITSRQNDVSAKMQRISNQNMVLARDSEEVAEKYNRMLSSAKSNSASLVGDGAKIPTNLSYDAMMGAAGANSGSSLYAITNANRQVVLSPAIAAKLSALGGATSGSAADFQNKYPASNIKQFITDIAGANVANAYSAASNGKSSSNFSINDLLNLSSTSKNNSFTKTYYDNELTSGDFNTFARSFDGHVSNNNGAVTVYRYISTSNKWQKDAQLAHIGQQNVTIADLYNCAGQKDGMIFLGGGYGQRKDKTERSQGPSQSNQDGAIKNLKTFAEGIGTQLVDALVKKGLDKTKVISAVSAANKETLKSYSNISWNDSFWQGKNQDNNYVSYNEGAIGSCMNFAHDTKNIVAMYSAGDDDWVFCVNAGSYAKDLVDKVMSLIGKAETTDTLGDISTVASFTIKTTYLTPTAKKDDNSDLVVSDASKASYYAELYKKLAAGGWTVDADVTDMSKLQEKFKNGTYLINDKNVQNVDSISEVCTEEQAKAYYDTEKAKINRKEKQLDTELTKLQTEYSSLTQDYNSVKSILDANIQRSFAYCQNG